MAQTTYKKLGELIRDTYYKLIPSDDVNYPLRYFCELIAQEVAEMAVMSAYENSNQGETTYANSQFISVYKNVPILEDEDGVKYSVMPATPAGLPNDQEIVSVRIKGNTTIDCIPIKAHMSFSQSLIGLPFNLVLYKIEDGKILYETRNPLIEGAVTFKMIGSVSGDDLVNSVLNIPKNYEARIMNNILQKLLPMKNIPPDYINDAISNPS